MVNVRGLSWGTTHPYHAEYRIGGWAIFDARTNEDVTHEGRLLVGLPEWEAISLGTLLNYGPNHKVDTEAIDNTP